jgi:pimeloyl-ACP methyl ester carboxylesterase/quercetin dioxygenase-like cupin family protein
MRKLALAFVFIPICAWSQDPAQVDPKHCRVEYEDDKIRVLREILPPGETISAHSHPERVTVVIRGSRIRFVQGGVTREVDVKTGEAIHGAAVQHTVTNIGNTTFEEVSTELKPTPPSSAPVTSSSVQQMAQHPAAGLPIPPPASTTPQPAPTPAPQPVRTKAEPAPKPPQQTNSAASQLEKSPAIVSPIEGAKTLSVNGQQLTYVEYGSGEPLVLVHGNGADLRSWSKQIDEFAKHYRVIAYSRRCHYPNACTGKEDDYTDEVHAKDLLAFMDGLDIRKARVVGNGYGASVAGVAATMQPDRFVAVVVAEPEFRKLLPELEAERAQYSINQIHQIMRKMYFKQHNLEGAMHAYTDWVKTGLWDTMDANTKQVMIDNGKAQIAYGAHPQAPNFTCETAKKITAPMLVMNGQDSPPNNRIISSTLAECAAAKRAVIPNAGPNMCRQNPEEFNRAVLEFLGSVK